MSILGWQPSQPKGQAAAAARLKSASSKLLAPGEVEVEAVVVVVEVEAAVAVAGGPHTAADQDRATTAQAAAQAGVAKEIPLLALLFWLSCLLASAASAIKTGELKPTHTAGLER